MKHTTNYQNWKIDIEDSGTVLVYDNGVLCDNTKGAICKIAKKAGFTIQENWNTRQAGLKLVKFLNENGMAAPTKEPVLKAIVR